MQRIQLPRGEWWYDAADLLGPEGGFGVVFAGGRSDGDTTLAVKRLKLSASDAAHRELRIASDLAGQAFNHVIPIYDAGLDADSQSYFVVMARAARSLQDELRGSRRYSDAEAVGILSEIARGLAEVPAIVHRDLKPGNVLLHDGRWKVADFGIARFVEDSTSLQTLKGCLSPPFAAPEQWRLERATAATDVYALGCIAVALLTGRAPFPGPGMAEFQHQHLHAEPPTLNGHAPRLRSLITLMLRKAPEARPGLVRVHTLLDEIGREGGSGAPAAGLGALASAGAVVAEHEAAGDAQVQARRSASENRQRVADEAVRILRGLAGELFQRITDAAPAAQRTENPLAVRLGQAQLKVVCRAGVVQPGAFAQSKWDVLAGATISVTQAQPQYVWSASLWYTNLGSGEAYRWYEVSYFTNPLMRSSAPFAPYALEDIAQADAAVAPGMAVQQVAWGPKPIDDEDAHAFCDRWADLLAKACQGQLTYPRYLPLQ